MSDENKCGHHAGREARELRKKADAYNDKAKDLHNAHEALEAERPRHKAEEGKSRTDVEALERQLTRERSDRVVERDQAREHAGDMQREKEERMRFFTIIAHDLRSPIATLVGYMDMLLARFDDLEKDQLKAYMVRLHAAVGRLSHLTESLLVWTKHKIGRFQCEWRDFDVKTLVDENVELFSETCSQKQIVLLSTVKEHVRVYADYDMIDAAMRNVVSNAVKYTEAKGTIRITAESRADRVVVSVSDDGVGMAESRLRSLFDPSPDRALSVAGTRGERGAGLGLLLCRELVEKSGGAIWVDSQEGCGTTVFLELRCFPPDSNEERSGVKCL